MNWIFNVLLACISTTKSIFKRKMLLFCSDGNCIHMVDNGIVEKLMDLLDRHVEDGNVTVQHAALSALRNLAIPGKV